MIDAETWAEARRLAKQGDMKLRQIARHVGIDRKTLNTVLQQPRYPGLLPKQRAPRGSMLDPHKPLIQLYLSECPGLSAVQVLDRLRREEGYQGEVTLVRDYLRSLRLQQREAFLRLTHVPGKVAQVDWATCGSIQLGNISRRLSLFVMVLAFSRYLYAEFSLSEKMDAFLEAHMRAFEAFGGVPARGVYDNCKTVVLQRSGAQIRFNPRLLEFSAHYLFQPRPCPPRRPHYKGIAENVIRYAKRNFVRGRPAPRDLETEQRALQQWLRETANVRVHRETGRKPAELLAEVERSALTPLPACPYDAAHIESVSANAFFEVFFDGNRYSVPHQYAHREGLVLRATTGQVTILDGAMELARNSRCYERGRRILDQAHQRGLLEKKRRAERDTQLGRLRELLGEKAEAYCAGLARKALRTEKHLRRILKLADQFGAREVREALELGLQHGAFGADSVEKGHSVLFTTAMDLVNQLEAAKSDETLLKKLKSFSRPDALIIDELGYLPIDKHGSDLIFQVVSQRYERGSIVLTTNRAPKQWDKVFNDATVASAVLDRLAHHSEIIVIEGKSFRTHREAS